MYFPAMPEFPLDAEILADVPRHLTDVVPDNLTALLAVSNGTSGPLADQDDDDLQLPDDQEIHDDLRQPRTFAYSWCVYPVWITGEPRRFS